MIRVLLLSLLGASITLAAALGASVPPLANPGVHQASAQAATVDPGARGAYAVGVTRRNFSRTSSTTGEPRALDTVIWYPAHPRAAALPIDETLRAADDAPPERAGAPYPVLVYSHGSVVQPWNSSFLTTHLASHGFVVLAPAHAGNTAESCPRPCDFAAPAFVEAQWDSAANRPDDVGAALTQALALGTADDTTLAGLLDGQRVGMSGHSFGAGTTLAVLARDQRFRAGVALALGTSTEAAARLAEQAAPRVAAPVLMMGGVLDDQASFPQQQRMFAAIPATGAEHIFVAFPRGGHFNYADSCSPTRGGCRPGDLPSEDAHGRINRWATAFLLRYVAGIDREASGWNAVLAQDDPEVQVTVVSGP